MIRANRPSDEWETCPAGALQGLSNQLRARRRIKTVRNYAAVVVVLLGVTALGIREMNVTHPTHARVTCSEVRDKAADFLAHRLSPAVEREFREHLAHCAHCKEIVYGPPKPQAGIIREAGERWVVARVR